VVAVLASTERAIKQKLLHMKRRKKIVNPVVLAASTSCSDVQPDLKNIAECGN